MTDSTNSEKSDPESLNDHPETYTAELVGPNGTESVELEFIDGLPRKSFTRATPGAEDDRSQDVVWELDEGAEEVFRYEPVATLEGS
jgi:hypothetical protein